MSFLKLYYRLQNHPKAIKTAKGSSLVGNGFFGFKLRFLILKDYLLNPKSHSLSPEYPAC